MTNFAFILWFCIFYTQFQWVIPAELHFYDDVMTIKGHNLNSSDINSRLTDRENITKIYVYVADTFYADVDLQLNGIEELQIFANIWNIPRPVTFNLSGFDGEKQVAAVDGLAGNSGNDGTAGGSFFGVANEIINGDYLMVISNGGNGGDGQDGGASNDIYVLFNVANGTGDSGWFSSGNPLDFYKKYFDEKGYISEVSGIDDYTSFYAIFVHDKKATFNMRLHPRECCGTTGMGGVGGLGGQSGKLTFKHIGNSISKSTPKFIRNDGRVGNLGKTGKECRSLALDVRIDTELNKVVLIVLPIHHSFSSHFTIIGHNDSSECSPVYASNDPEMDSTGSSEPNDIDVVASVIRYKRFLLANMRNESLTAVVQETYRAIDDSQEINEKYSLADYITEACELEEKYFELRNFVNMTSMYHRLLDRIQRLRLQGNVEYDERALVYLREILTVKLRDLKKEFNLVVNLELYVEAIVSSIDLRNRRLPAITNVNNAKLHDGLNRLRFGVNGNFILAEYYHVIDEFKRTYFPFAVNYLGIYSIPLTLIAYNSLDDITSTTISKLNTLSQSIRYIKSNNAEIMMNLNYFDDTSPDDALFVWKNSDVRDKVRELFQGKMIELFADVKQAPKDYNAFKFNRVELIFRSSNDTINDQLKTTLESFELELNHTGRSAIRCNDKIFRVNNNPAYLMFSLAKGRNDMPLSRVMTYDKIRENPPTLSPYAWWEVKILELDKSIRRFRSFAKIEKFAQFDFNIELHGTGSFIVEDVPICENANLLKFYSAIDS